VNNKQRLQIIIAPWALGIGLTVGINAPVVAHPDNSSIYSDAFRNTQPFRSLNVTPLYHTPLPPSNDYDDHERYYRDRWRDDEDVRDDNDDRYGCENCRQRRVFRRGIRQPDVDRRSRDYRPHSDRYIRIRFE
jgi:hypothetical protein